MPLARHPSDRSEGQSLKMIASGERSRTKPPWERAAPGPLSICHESSLGTPVATGDLLPNKLMKSTHVEEHVLANADERTLEAVLIVTRHTLSPAGFVGCVEGSTYSNKLVGLSQGY